MIIRSLVLVCCLGELALACPIQERSFAWGGGELISSDAPVYRLPSRPILHVRVVTELPRFARPDGTPVPILVLPIETGELLRVQLLVDEGPVRSNRGSWVIDPAYRPSTHRVLRGEGRIDVDTEAALLRHEGVDGGVYVEWSRPGVHWSEIAPSRVVVPVAPGDRVFAIFADGREECVFASEREPEPDRMTLATLLLVVAAIGSRRLGARLASDAVERGL
jgi:hypothetical protein